MSREDVQIVVEMDPPGWRSLAQFGVLVQIAKYYNPQVGFAWPSVPTIAARLGVGSRRVRTIIHELEALGLIVRLGPDRQVGKGTLASGTNRYVPLWRVPDDVQRAIREAVDADRRCALDASSGGSGPVENPVSDGSDGVETEGTPGSIDPAPLIYRSSPPGSIDQAPPGSIDPPNVRTPNDRSNQVEIGTETAAAIAAEAVAAPAAATLSVAALLARARRSLLDQIRQKRHAHLAAAPADDHNFRAVCKAIRDVLHDPPLGSRLVKGYRTLTFPESIPSDGFTSIDERENVIEAARRLCDRRHIDWGRPSRDVLRNAYELEVAKAEFQIAKARILAGGTRPRDRAADRPSSGPPSNRRWTRSW